MSHLTYEKRLLSLDLPKLDTRRMYFDLIECFKIIHGLTRSYCHAFVSLSQLHTRGYGCKLKAVSEPARLDVRRHFFVERIISQWNALPVEITQQQNYNHFKLLLRKHLKL